MKNGTGMIYSALMTFLMLFSAFARGTITSWPQTVHFKRKSMPVRRQRNCVDPQGCFFFISKMSPI